MDCAVGSGSTWIHGFCDRRGCERLGYGSLLQQDSAVPDDEISEGKSESPTDDDASRAILLQKISINRIWSNPQRRRISLLRVPFITGFAQGSPSMHAERFKVMSSTNSPCAEAAPKENNYEIRSEEPIL